MQIRFNGSMLLALIFGITLTWYIGSDACVNYAVTWYGNPAVTFIIVCLQVLPPALPPRLQGKKPPLLVKKGFCITNLYGRQKSFNIKT